MLLNSDWDNCSYCDCWPCWRSYKSSTTSPTTTTTRTTTTLINNLSAILIIIILIVPSNIYTTTASIISSTTSSKIESNNQNDASSKLSQYPVLLVVSFDGFRYNFFQESKTSHMDELRYKGVRSVMKNQFPTKTFPNHQSIVTGLYPESHGVVENQIYDPLYDQVLGAENETLWRFRDDVVPIWTLNQWAGGNRSSGAMMWPGCEFPYGANRTYLNFHQAYDTSIPYEHRIETILSWITHNASTDGLPPANQVFIHFEEPDSTAHAWGPNSTQTKLVIQQMDNVTGYLVHRLQELSIYDKINLILLSDHGFHSVSTKNIINITHLVNPASAGGSGYKTYGKSPVINILPNNEDELEMLYNQFVVASTSRNFTVYKKTQIQQLKSYWNFHNNRRIQPLILVSDPGYVFDDFYDDIINYYAKPPWNHPFTEESIYGTHGYDNHDMSMHPFFIATGPLFYSDGRDVNSFENLDLFPLFCYIGGFGPPKSNGTQSAIKLVLKHERQFRLGASSVGWIVVIAVIFGLMILTVILSFLRQTKPHKQLSSNSISTTTGYKFINRQSDYEDDDYDDSSETRVLVTSNSDYEDEDDDPSLHLPPNHSNKFQEPSLPSNQDKDDKLLDISSTSVLVSDNNIKLNDLNLEKSSDSNNYKEENQLVNMLDDEDVEEFEVSKTNNNIKPVSSGIKKSNNRVRFV